MLAGYGVKAGVVLKQINVLSKENEISAAPKVLAGLELTGKVVTGAACSPSVIYQSKLWKRVGHYLWRVKDNQPSLRADIERLFGPESVPLRSALLRTDFQSVSTTTEGHGHLETHTLTTSALPNASSDWPYVDQVFQVVRAVLLTQP